MTGFWSTGSKNVRSTQDQRHERRRKRKSDQSCVEAAMEVEDVLLNQEEEVAQEKVNAS